METTQLPWLLRVRFPQRARPDERLADALRHIAAESMSVAVETDLETDEIRLLARSEDDLEMAVIRLHHDFHLRPDTRAPEVIYREAVRSRSEIDNTFTGRVQGRPGFARIRLTVSPGDDNRLEIRTPVDAPSARFLDGVERGFRSILDRGPRQGFPVLGLHATLLEVETDDSSTPLAVEVATRQALFDAMRKSGIALMEPVMKVTVVATAKSIDAVAGDIVNRRGRVLSKLTSGDGCTIEAHIPLGNLFGYINNLRQMTSGAGTFTQLFSHFAEVPPPPGPDDFRPAIGMRV